MSFIPSDIPQCIVTASAEAFIGRRHVAEAYAFDGRSRAYAAFFCAKPAQRPLWASHDGCYSVACIDDPDFEIPETAVLPGPDFTPPIPVLLRHFARTVGFYVGGMAWIDPDHRGHGLAPKMILAGCIASGGPTYDTSSIVGFSPAGLASHLAAHREAVKLTARLQKEK